MKFKEFLASYTAFLSECPRETIDRDSRLVFLSDLHMGDGSGRDDLEHNRNLLEALLSRRYLERGYTLVLNGDIEDLSKFRYPDIRAAWSSLYEIFDAFARAGRLRKIVGNHDLGLLKTRDYPFERIHGLVLEHGPDRIFAFHGHQGSPFFTKHDYISHFVVRYLAKPLAIKNASVDDHGKRRFRLERRIYRASQALGVASVIGHTHRPLFESRSKYDSLRWAIEELVAEYPSAAGTRREEIADLVGLYRAELARLGRKELSRDLAGSRYHRERILAPCLFNSGCATGRNGITALELADDTLSLVQWTGAAGPKPYILREALEAEPLEGTPNVRYLLRRSNLDNIFARIRLLGRDQPAK
jgi:hypothetical protein